MKGLFYQCNTESIEFLKSTSHIITKWDCLSNGGVWLNKINNFDNILNAMITLFQVAST